MAADGRIISTGVQELSKRVRFWTRKIDRTKGGTAYKRQLPAVSAYKLKITVVDNQKKWPATTVVRRTALKS